MATDKYVVTKSTTGTNPLSVNPFQFITLSDLIPGLFGSQDSGIGVKCVAKGTYNFAIHGGATGAHTLLPGDQLIPAGAIITDVFFDVKTTCTSGGSATIALGVNTTTDLKAATTYASFTTSALVAGIPVGTAATAVRVTADSNLTLTIGTVALTAGKINVIVEYVVSD